MSDYKCKVSRVLNHQEMQQLYNCDFPSVLCGPDVREFGIECSICNRSKGC